MKEQRCKICGALNEVEFTLRVGDTGSVTVRCKTCKKLFQIEAAVA